MVKKVLCDSDKGCVSFSYKKEIVNKTADASNWSLAVNGERGDI